MGAVFPAADLRPMLAVAPDVEPPLDDPRLVYEPKYDGIRAIVLVEPGPAAHVRMWSRNGNEKSRQFPELVAALSAWAASLDAPVVLDGEIVALDAMGAPAGFQRLQGRINVSVPGYRSSAPPQTPAEQPTALVVFDLLRDGDVDWRPRPLHERRARARGALSRDAGLDAAPPERTGGRRRARTVRARASARAGRGCSSRWPTRRTAPAGARPSGASSRFSNRTSSSSPAGPSPRARGRGSAR